MLTCIQYCPKGRGQNSPQWDDKNMLGNIGDLFVKCMPQVTKSHLYHLFGDNYVMYSFVHSDNLYNEVIKYKLHHPSSKLKLRGAPP